MRQAAARILEHGRRRTTAPVVQPAAVALVISELGPYLANLMGSAGFRALLLRSLTLASAESKWTRAVGVNAAGRMDGLEELEAELGADDFSKGCIRMLALLLSLLAAFVGEGMTRRLVLDIWPDLSVADLDSATGDG